jgi:hypothetical protein
MSAAIAAGVLTVAGTAYAANRSNAAAGAQAGAANQANQLSDKQQRQARADNAPWTVTGGGAENALGRLFGLPTTTPDAYAQQQSQLIGDAELPGNLKKIPLGGGNWDIQNPDGTSVGTLVRGGANGKFQPNGVAIAQPTAPTQGAGAAPTGPDLSQFTASPGYQFRRDEGTRGITNSFGASGGAFSGNALKALSEFNSNLASNEFGNYVNQLSTIAGNGQQATSQNNQLGAAAAATQGNNTMYAGDARASGIENTANVVSGGLNQLGQIAGYYSKPKPKTVPGPYGY